MNFWMKLWNGFNLAALQSPLHWLTSGSTLLLTIKGRKSGKPITLPVNYTQQGTIVRITSKPERQWWRNLKINPEVRVTLRGKVLPGNAQVFDTPEEVEQELIAFLRPRPKMAKYFQIHLNKNGTFNQEDVLQSAQQLVIIRVEVPASTER